MDTDHDRERLALCLPERIAALSKHALRREYFENDAEAGDPVQEALAAELQIRNIDL